MTTAPFSDRIAYQVLSTNSQRWSWAGKSDDVSVDSLQEMNQFKVG